ncbi:hypothetical protein K488DRAFT_84576 [Vararia minispora EC-137]|uniref:Uncharacterized protein n=1 Tax=Vararia minispora EC-137 TaxID=1314806 RepID=A0ACB8QQ84_9AGAM|nr:hypothetical protein K488DRAFT_84576 [Vararia minispora EC-137]
MSSLVPTLGPALLGVLISTVQVVIHYFLVSWYKDHWALKVFVLWIWMLDTAHTAIEWAFEYRVSVVDFGNAATFEVTTPADDLLTLFTALSILSVHGFYVRRLWILSGKSYLLCCTVTLLAVAHFVLVLTVMALTFKFPDFLEFFHVTPFYTASLASAAATDVLIAVAMWRLLWPQRSGVRRVLDIAILICFVTLPPSNLAYLALYDVSPNLYVLSLLAMLNARKALSQTAAPSAGMTGVGLHAHDADGAKPGANANHVSSELAFKRYVEMSTETSSGGSDVRV